MDEDTYNEAESFETVSKKMFSLTADGKVKKRILKAGEDVKPEPYATVKIHYNGYLEFERTPFDSTFARNRPHKFILNDGKVIVGLDIAVQSMKLREKSQFLFDPSYAYGGCLVGRVPHNSTVLFEIELLDIINSGATLTYDNLPEERQNDFIEIFKYAEALCERGKSSFKAKNLKAAIKDFNTALVKLEKVMLNNKGEAEKQKQLMLRLYSNLLISYSVNFQYRKGCETASRIYACTEDGEIIKIPVKVYFNHAKCLRMLGDFANARSYLEKAMKLEPRNTELINEMLTLDHLEGVNKKKEVQFAQAALKQGDRQ